ncbi:MAG: heme-binding domain-containing protein [Actinomycetota bacterium]|nr:heme-binding domain-containing protein [Actinomycetota bacterium]MDQ6945020.1 heme-binding domain-containing protein [Actinomycetota bacterium]
MSVESSGVPETRAAADPAAQSPRQGRLRWRSTALVVFAGMALFGLAQLVPYRVSNPAVRQEPAWPSPQARALVVRACYNCHSNQARSPWYTQIAPISWWTTSHVRDGRAQLNFSDWANRGGEEDLAGAVAGGSMLPSYYTWFGLHPEAKLSSKERSELIAVLKFIDADGGGSTGARVGGTSRETANHR